MGKYSAENVFGNIFPMLNKYNEGPRLEANANNGV